MGDCLTQNDRTAVTNSLTLKNNAWNDAKGKYNNNLSTEIQSQDIQIVNGYNEVINFISNRLNCINNSDINNKLQQIGTLQNTIDTNKTELKRKQADLETAQARQEVTNKPEQQTTLYESVSGRLGFTKPLHMVSISILIGLGIFFLFNSGLMMKEFFSPVQQPDISTSPSFANRLSALQDSFQQGVDNYGSSLGSFFFFMRDPRFYAVLAGFVFVSIIMGFLAYYGYLGKK